MAAGALSGSLAGVTVFGPNIDTPGQLAALTARLRSARDEPLIAIDEEGGDVTRIAHRDGSPYPGNAALGAVDDVALTEAVYRALGGDLAALGINVDLAPSVDVNTAADNPVIGTRSFGSDTGLVARHAAAAVRGLQAAGVAACAKHFPGHGSTRSDTHQVIATVEGSMELITRRDLPPFEAAIAAGVRAVMPGHLRVPGLTGDLPASLSPAALTGLLRRDLGFSGVIISDALEMRAVRGPFGIPEAAVLAVAAGTDLLCFGRDQDQPTYLAVRDALVSAVGDGRLPGARLEEAAASVAGLRAWTAAHRQQPVRAAATALARPPATALARPPATALARPPATASAWPPRAARSGRTESPARSMIRSWSRWCRPPTWPSARSRGGWAPGFRRRASAGSAPPAAPAGTAAGALAAAAGRSLVIVVRDAHRYPAARELVRRLLAARPDAIVVEMGLPVWRPPAGGYVATYGAARTSGQAAAEVLGFACR